MFTQTWQTSERKHEVIDWNARRREFELDVAYNPQADHESWQALQDFFESLF